MASLPEIIAAEDTPADLITVVDETTVRAEVEAWRAKLLKRPGLWDRATRGTQERIVARRQMRGQQHLREQSRPKRLSDALRLALA